MWILRDSNWRQAWTMSRAGSAAGLGAFSVLPGSIQLAIKTIAAAPATHQKEESAGRVPDLDRRHHRLPRRTGRGRQWHHGA